MGVLTYRAAYGNDAGSLDPAVSTVRGSGDLGRYLSSACTSQVMHIKVENFSDFSRGCISGRFNSWRSSPRSASV